MRRHCQSEFVTYRQILVVEAVNLDGPVDHLTSEDELPAEPLRSPGDRGGVRDIALPDEIVELVRVRGHHVLGIYSV
jgi:hypothetical protein